MKVQVLGPGCRSCKQLHKEVIKAVDELNLQIEIEYITDMAKIVETGIMSLPALIINDVLVSSGKLLSSNQIKELLSDKNKPAADQARK